MNFAVSHPNLFSVPDRPKCLMVLLNPASGKFIGQKIFDSVAAPLFELADVKINLTGMFLCTADCTESSCCCRCCYCCEHLPPPNTSHTNVPPTCQWRPPLRCCFVAQLRSALLCACVCACVSFLRVTAHGWGTLDHSWRHSWAFYHCFSRFFVKVMIRSATTLPAKLVSRLFTSQHKESDSFQAPTRNLFPVTPHDVCFYVSVLERGGHAKRILQECNLDEVDGWVCVTFFSVFKVCEWDAQMRQFET